jgi:hypothetical protein
MNILQAFGMLLLGVGLGGLLAWLQQTAARRQFREELETLTDKAFPVARGTRGRSVIKLV